MHAAGKRTTAHHRLPHRHGRSALAARPLVPCARLGRRPGSYWQRGGAAMHPASGASTQCSTWMTRSESWIERVKMNLRFIHGHHGWSRGCACKYPSSASSADRWTRVPAQQIKSPTQQRLAIPAVGLARASVQTASRLCLACELRGSRSRSPGLLLRCNEREAIWGSGLPWSCPRPSRRWAASASPAPRPAWPASVPRVEAGCGLAPAGG